MAEGLKKLISELLSLLLFDYTSSAMENTVYSLRQIHILAETRSFV